MNLPCDSENFPQRGFLPIDKKGADLLFQVISKRYEKGRIILTTNKVFKGWGEIFGNDNIAASALLRESATTATS